MIRAVSCGFLVIVAGLVLAGCNSKPKAEGGEDTPKTTPTAKTEAPTVEGTKKKPSPAVKKEGKGGQGIVSDDSPRQAESPTGPVAMELTRLENKGMVVFYKGFTEDEMKTYTDRFYKYYGRGQGGSSDALLYYQVRLAKENKGMHVVREDDFTKIIFPVEARLKNNTDYFAKLGLALGGSLSKIGVKGQRALAISNDDCTVIYRATDNFNKK